MNYPRILQAFSERPWAITQTKLEIIRGVLEARAAGVSATKEDIQAAVGAGRPGSGSTISTGTIALIPVHGIITQRAGMFSEYSGGCSMESYTRALDQAMADPNITAVMTEFDTPGGSVYGVPEAAAKIRAYRGVKPHWAMLNPAACSAGIWLAAQCERVVVTPSGDAGSVGVYMVHYDWSKWNEEAGVKPTYIFAAPYKVEGNPDQPLSDDTRAYWQSQVDATYDQFIRAMATGRGVSAAKVKSDFGKGRVLMAQDAKDAGLVDDIAPIDEVIRDLAKQKGKRASVTVPGQAASGTSTLSVSVVDAAGARIPGVEVALAGAAAAHGVTGGLGVVLFNELAAGPYTVTASLHGFKTSSIALTSDGSELTAVQLVMTAGADDEPVDPNEAGECPEGYEKRDDGLCYLAPADTPVDQAQIDRDQLALAIALGEAGQ